MAIRQEVVEQDGGSGDEGASADRHTLMDASMARYLQGGRLREGSEKGPRRVREGSEKGPGTCAPSPTVTCPAREEREASTCGEGGAGGLAAAMAAVWVPVWQRSGGGLADNSLAAVWVQSGRQQSGSCLGAV